AAVADNRTIIRDTDQAGWPAGHGAQTPAAQLERAVKLDLDLFVGTRHLPRILSLQPIVRPFLLPTVVEALFENSVFVSQAIAHGGEMQGSSRFDETGRQPPQVAVTQSRIRFLLQQLDEKPFCWTASFMTAPSRRLVTLFASDLPIKNSIER